MPQMKLAIQPSCEWFTGLLERSVKLVAPSRAGAASDLTGPLTGGLPRRAAGDPRVPHANDIQDRRDRRLYAPGGCDVTSSA